MPIYLVMQEFKNINHLIDINQAIYLCGMSQQETG